MGRDARIRIFAQQEPRAVERSLAGSSKSHWRYRCATCARCGLLLCSFEPSCFHAYGHAAIWLVAIRLLLRPQLLGHRKLVAVACDPGRARNRAGTSGIQASGTGMGETQGGALWISRRAVSLGSSAN